MTEPNQGSSRGLGIGMVVGGVALLGCCICGGVFLIGGVDILKPALPIVVTKRDSIVGAGMVAQFHNQTNEQLTVNLVFQNKKKNQRKEGSINIPANGTVEIGWLEGWQFESGETVTISNPNYASKTWTIP